MAAGRSSTRPPPHTAHTAHAPAPRLDTSAFSSSTFDVVAWLNDTLPSPAAATPAATARLGGALTDAAATAHGQLETALADGIAAVPAAVRATEVVRRRATALRSSVTGVTQRVAGVEAGVASSVATIAAADGVVRRVEAARGLLRAAADAERLSARADTLLAAAAADGAAEAALPAAADALAALRSALAPLEGVAELSAARSALAAADGRLDAAAAPRVSAAVANRDAAGLVAARAVFVRAGRQDAFFKYYVGATATALRRLWADAWRAPLPGRGEGGKAHDGHASDGDREGVRVAVSGAAADRGDGGTGAMEEGIVAGSADAADGDGGVAGVGRAGSPPPRRVADLTTPDGVVRLGAFYDAFTAALTTEAAWLSAALPDIVGTLLPRAVAAALAALGEPALVSSAAVERAAVEHGGDDANAAAAAAAAVDALYASAGLSQAFTARLARLLLQAAGGHSDLDLPSCQVEVWNRAAEDGGLAELEAAAATAAADAAAAAAASAGAAESSTATDLAGPEAKRDSRAAAAPQGDGSSLPPAAPFAVDYTAVECALTAALWPSELLLDAGAAVEAAAARSGASAAAAAAAAAADASSATTGGAGDVARAVEMAGTPLLSLAAAAADRVRDVGRGAGYGGWRATAGVLAAVASRRFASASHGAGGTSSASDAAVVAAGGAGPGGAGWPALSAALRLLRALSSLAREWDDLAAATAASHVTTAAPLLQRAAATVDASAAVKAMVFSAAPCAADGAVLWALVIAPGRRRRLVDDLSAAPAATADVPAGDWAPALRLIQHRVYDAMMAGVRPRLDALPGMGVWRVSGGDTDPEGGGGGGGGSGGAGGGGGGDNIGGGGGGAGGEDLDGDAGDAGDGGGGFSHSPLAYATEVAEHLMTLPQQLEPWVPDAPDTPYAVPWAVSVPTAYVSGGGAGSPPSQADDDDGSWAARWMAAVAGGTMALYVERLCGIPRLTPGGAAQLATDVEYVMTVAAALGVTPVPALAFARRLLEVEPTADAIRAAVEEPGGGGGEVGKDLVEQERKKLGRRVAAVRGLHVDL
ncbi:hypothetical protein MMPV_002572 [Pyropia vietnamensis]